MRWVVAVLILVLVLPMMATALEEMYCGEKDCYKELEVSQTATAGEIKKAYYALAMKWHPDKNSDPEAEHRFRDIAQAYEILSDVELRKAYDDFRANPEAYYRHRYTYYRHRYAPKTDLRIVLSAFVIVVSILHYLLRLQAHSNIVGRLLLVPEVQRKIRLRMDEILYEQGVNNAKKAAARVKEAAQEQAKAEVLATCVIEGFSAKPTWRSLFCVWLVMLPYRIASYVCWYVRWVILFDIMKQEYGRMEKIYLTSSIMRMEMDKFLARPQEFQEEWLAKELYIPEKLQELNEQAREEMRGKHKAQRRFMKKYYS